jgi:hypothetical protein
MTWRSNSLFAGFDRTVVGFDLRRCSSLSRLFITSYDESVRYEEIIEKYEDKLLGMHFFNVDPSKISSLVIPSDGRIVAFDLPVSLVDYLLNCNIVSPQPLSIELNIDEWKFMGFDIVDAYFQYSAFHGFNWATSTAGELEEKFNFPLNDVELIANDRVALRAAEFFDGLIEQHAPFAPCGIWLKKI